MDRRRSIDGINIEDGALRVTAIPWLHGEEAFVLLNRHNEFTRLDEGVLMGRA